MSVSGNRRLRILVVDDDEMVGQTVAAMAGRDGHEVRVTASAEEFLDAIDDWHPDLVILDLILPGIDGVQILATLAERAFTASIVIMSGVGQRVLDAARRSAQEHNLNIAGVLPKPFSHRQLSEMLERGAEFLAEGEALSTEQESSEPPLNKDNLQDALDRGQLVVHYQAKVECDSLALAGFEALVRWQHPERGLVPPAEFIALAEESKLIGAVTRFVIDDAMAWFGSLRDCEGFGDLHLSINLSARLLDSEEWLERLLPACEEAGLDPGQVCFELTETAAMDDPTASLDLLTRLRVKGFLLSVDDFGTGYSSMVQLARLPFSEIKIDKSFVMSAEASEESRQVVKSIVELGRGLEMVTVAEGVESEWAVEFLQSLGCMYLQGYYFGRPGPGDEVRRAWKL